MTEPLLSKPNVHCDIYFKQKRCDHLCSLGCILLLRPWQACSIDVS